MCLDEGFVTIIFRATFFHPLPISFIRLMINLCMYTMYISILLYPSLCPISTQLPPVLRLLSPHRQVVDTGYGGTLSDRTLFRH